MALGLGLHHVTAICGDPRVNLDFYSRLLSLRLVKRTVNFDDPTTWHLYYGNETGAPGTAMTFFPFAGMPAGRIGTGLVAETAFAVPKGALALWRERFAQRGIRLRTEDPRFGDARLAFADPDGLPLALVEREEAGALPAWIGGEVPSDAAIRGFDGVTLWTGDSARSLGMFMDILGYRPVASEGAWTRLAVPGAALGGYVDLLTSAGLLAGRMGTGSIHHIAFRAKSDSDQSQAADALARAYGIAATEQRDRCYFRSVYFREPTGVICEIATDDPGFTLDEPKERLGTSLKLPPWLEDRRNVIAASLLPLT
jgi:glyoxalase family protein